MVARRIVCFTQEGAHLAAGDRFGLIRFGSRVDVYLPDGARVVVGLGARAVGGRDGDRRIRPRRTAAPVPPELTGAEPMTELPPSPVAADAPDGRACRSAPCRCGC